MSQENVEVVRSLLPGPDVDMTETLRNDDVWAASVPASSALIHPDFECVGTLFGSETNYAGMDGFRQFLLDWLTPWESYRAEVEQTIDAGEQVVTVYRIFGRRSGHVHEV